MTIDKNMEQVLKSEMKQRSITDWTKDTNLALDCAQAILYPEYSGFSVSARVPGEKIFPEYVGCQSLCACLKLDQK